MRLWIKILAALILIALLLWLGWNLVQGMVKLAGGGGENLSEPDPMFAEEMHIPTRPPELDAEETPPDRPTLDDLAPVEGAPVDKTAEQLIEEAKQKSNS